MPKEQLPF